MSFSILYFSNAWDAQSTASCCMSSDMSAFLITALRSAMFASCFGLQERRIKIKTTRFLRFEIVSAPGVWPTPNASPRDVKKTIVVRSRRESGFSVNAAAVVYIYGEQQPRRIDNGVAQAGYNC